MQQGLDADQNLSDYAADIKAAGLTFVMRYLKNLSSAEVEALHGAGLSVGLIFETTGDRALGGADAGAEDGAEALRQARALGAPSSVAIYATVDGDVAEEQLDAVGAYFVAFDGCLWASPTEGADPVCLYRIGGYADGTAISGLRDEGLPLCWLAGAMGWDGSRVFLATGKPDLVQGPTLTAGGHWSPVPEQPLAWPDLGFAYDPDVALSDDIGAWNPPAV